MPELPSKESWGPAKVACEAVRRLRALVVSAFLPREGLPKSYFSEKVNIPHPRTCYEGLLKSRSLLGHAKKKHSTTAVSQKETTILINPPRRVFRAVINLVGRQALRIYWHSSESAATHGSPVRTILHWGPPVYGSHIKIACSLVSSGVGWKQLSEVLSLFGCSKHKVASQNRGTLM